MTLYNNTQRNTYVDKRCSYSNLNTYNSLLPAQIWPISLYHITSRPEYKDQIASVFNGQYSVLLHWKSDIVLT